MSDDLRNRVVRAIQAVEIPESGWPEDRAGVWLMALDEAVKAADAALAEIGAVRVREAARVLLGAGCDGVPWLTWGVDNHLNAPPSYAVGDAPWPAPDGNKKLADAVRSALTTIAEAED